jgi:spore germination cell wall hydrolase CwlJ-like protein
MNDYQKRLLAEVAWKENRAGKIPGMTSIINVVMNRSKMHHVPVDSIIMQPKQFTSMSVRSDPEYGVDPSKSTGIDAVAWASAQQLASQADSGTLKDITNGSTLYYSPKSIKTNKYFKLPSGEMVLFPQTWNPKAVKFQAEIAGQLFFTAA